MAQAMSLEYAAISSALLPVRQMSAAWI